MLFNSFEFIFIFLPIVFGGYFLFNHLNKENLAVYWLILSCFIFYGYFNPAYLYLIALSIGVNYFLGWLLTNEKYASWKKAILVIGLIFNLGILGYYKYADFFITNINTVFGSDYSLLYVLLPLGLSFITFQMVGYLVDAYRGETKKYSLKTFTLFVTFFPQLIAGPIIQHNETMPQFEEKKNKRINWDNIAVGSLIFIIGLTKKVAIADTVAIWANDGFANYQTLSFLESWITSLSYTIQLYFDFSGYCDMAIGLSLLFNIKIPINFNSPYKARNIQDFWKRWHMTLNRFLTQYLYIPLGGSRLGETRTYINIFLVFFVSGIWHGAGWTFVIWGVLHGLASIIVRLWSKTKINLPYWLAWFITFQFVNIAWVYFRATSIEQANMILMKMFQPNWSELQTFFSQPIENFTNSATFDYGYFVLNNPKIIVLSIVVLLVFSFVGKNSVQILKTFTFKWRYIVMAQCLLMLVLMTTFFMQKNSVFLYFNF